MSWFLKVSVWVTCLLVAVVSKCSVQRAGICESDKAFKSQQEECIVLMQWLPVIYLENIKGIILLAVQNVE